ncbi:signal peptidase I [Sporosalibacterium faouarense]|uniref:signal peptidase I n=1 Tax=Sporosalibacterium faouarense TaxID=516123 RepID=UPI00141CD879|nr:signal peptidase I [Sporosalibacterium faouarense]MTI49378.1 signal peptidase I [Bacillota bacterium]
MDKKEAWDWIKSIGLALIIAVLIKTFLLNTTYVLGSSMYPTLHEKDRLFTNKVGYYIGEPKRGDIIVLKAPDDPEKDYIKRVVGLAGDKVEITDGKVYVNGEELKEKYLTEGSYTYTEATSKWDVPEEYIFVMGDNRNKRASNDSRSFGSIPIDTVKGKAFFRYYPFGDRFGSLYK